MPNYQYVIPNTFQPFTMDEMLKPYMIASQVYENTEKQYNELQDKAGKFKYLSETLPEDSKARQIYEGYANDLNKQAESLIRSGLNVNSLNALSQLRGRYSGEIGRIMEADTAKRAQEEEQRKALLQNPTMLFDRRADLTSIDDYLINSHLGYTPYSGAMLAQQTGQMAQALARHLRSYGQGKPLDGFTNTWLQQRGFTPDEVLQAIENPSSPNSSKVLSSIVDSVMGSSGITKWKDQETIARAYDYANQGLWQAIGQDQVAPFENYQARLDAQMEKEMAIAREKAAIKSWENAQKDKNDSSNKLNPRPMIDEREVDAFNKKIAPYKQYFYKNSAGQYVMSYKGLKEYNRKIVSYADPENIESEKVYRDSPFKIFVDTYLNGKKYIKNGKMQPGNLGNAFLNYYNTHKDGSYDMYHSTDYYKQVSGNTATAWTKQVKSASKNKDTGEIELQPVKFRSQKGWVNDGKVIKGKDTQDYEVVGVSGSRWGTTVEMLNPKTGESIRVKANLANINTTADTNTQGYINEADLWGEVRRSKYWPKLKIEESGGVRRWVPVLDSKGNIVWDKTKTMTDVDRQQAKEAQEEALNNANREFMNGVQVSSTKKDEIGEEDDE